MKNVLQLRVIALNFHLIIFIVSFYIFQEITLMSTVPMMIL